MKAITFLGLGHPEHGYQQTTYVWKEKKKNCRLFSAALPSLWPEVTAMAVYVTEESRDRYWEELVAEVGDKVQLTAVLIPWGGDEAQLWEIFAAVVGQVGEGDSVLFDITHGFRSLPFLVFLAVAYLKTARAVEVAGIVYGAFEAGDKEANTTPVFDLTPMASLLDWLAALHLFRETGRAGELEGLLRQIQAGAHRSGQRDPPTGLIPVGQSLLRLSENLRLIRPLDAMEQAAILAGQLTEERLVEAETWAKPFALVAPLVKETVGPLAGEAAVCNLAGQAALLDWYVTHEQPVHALTLAREMVVTWVARELGGSDLRSEAVRNPAEAVLNWWGCRVKKAGEGYRGEPPTGALDRLRWSEGLGKRVGELWNQLADTRNDVDHAGMRAQPASASSLNDRSKKLVTEVCSLLRADPSEPPLSEEEIERYIRAERDSWGDR